MLYQEIPPSPPLAGFIQCFWVLEGIDNDRTPELIVPDGRMEMVFNLADPFRQQCDGRVGVQPRALIVGEVKRPVIVQPADRISLLGIRFRPGGIRPFVMFPATELTDSIVELEVAWGAARVKEMEERLREAPSLCQRVMLLESFLLEQAGDLLELDKGVVGAVAAITSAGGSIRIKTLAASIGLSGRQLERRFLQTVGLTPKIFARIVRFQRIFRVIEREGGASGPVSGRAADWASAAFRAGYYDQAHFIRDFKEFAGISPSAYFARQNELSEFFIAGADAASPRFSS